MASSPAAAAAAAAAHRGDGYTVPPIAVVEIATCSSASICPLSNVKRRSSKEPQYKHQLSPNDVLLGRGTGSNECEGNVRFRSIVMKVLQRSFLSHQSISKGTMAASVLKLVQDRGGKFVRKLSSTESNSARTKKNLEESSNSSSDLSSPDDTSTCPPPLFVVVSRAVAMEKTKQSFRHQKRVLEIEQERTQCMTRQVASARDQKSKFHSKVQQQQHQQLLATAKLPCLASDNNLCSTLFLRHLMSWGQRTFSNAAATSLSSFETAVSPNHDSLSAMSYILSSGNITNTRQQQQQTSDSLTALSTAASVQGLLTRALAGDATVPASTSSSWASTASLLQAALQENRNNESLLLQLQLQARPSSALSLLSSFNPRNKGADFRNSQLFSEAAALATALSSPQPPH